MSTYEPPTWLVEREKVPPADFFDLADNRQITDADVAACRALVADINKATNTEDHLACEAWVDPKGLEVHAQFGKANFQNITADSLRLLRFNCWFSGWKLKNLISIAPEWSWMDSLSAHFPAENDKDWSISAFRHYTSELPPEYICNAPLVGGEIGFRVGNRCVNMDVVSFQARMALLYKLKLLEPLKEDSNPVILEIGGGYGALAYFIKAIIPQATYCIVDLPESLMYSACYLTLCKQAVHVSKGTDISKHAGQFILIPPSNLEKHDMTIDTLSFAEMPAQVVSEYAAYISRNLSPGGVLFEQNFDCSYLNRPNFCNPRIAIAPHFKHMLEPQEKTFWGTPRVWSN
jgi:putative sugar O-methyltransferase